MGEVCDEEGNCYDDGESTGGNDDNNGYFGCDPSDPTYPECGNTPTGVTNCPDGYSDMNGSCVDSNGNAPDATKEDTCGSGFSMVNGVCMDANGNVGAPDPYKEAAKNASKKDGGLGGAAAALGKSALGALGDLAKGANATKGDSNTTYDYLGGSGALGGLATALGAQAGKAGSLGDLLLGGKGYAGGGGSGSGLDLSKILNPTPVGGGEPSPPGPDQPTPPGPTPDMTTMPVGNVTDPISTTSGGTGGGGQAPWNGDPNHFPGDQSQQGGGIPPWMDPKNPAFKGARVGGGMFGGPGGKGDNNTGFKGWGDR